MHAVWGRTFKDPFSPEFSSQIYGIGFFDSRTFQHAGMPPLLIVAITNQRHEISRQSSTSVGA